jgi:hypothetical protein
MAYASGTSVTVPNSQLEISRTLARYGVESYSFGATPGFALVEFEHQHMPIRLQIPLPTKPVKQKGSNPKTGRTIDLWAAHEQDVKEAWRALLLFIKAALESVDRGIVTVQQAFMAFLVTSEGQTLGQDILPRYVQALTDRRLAIEAGSS